MSRIVCLDVQYGAMHGAKAAVVAFDTWDAKEPIEQHVVDIANVAPYESGAFYKRELPCIRAALASLTNPADIVVVDAHAWLEPGVPGLGARLLADELSLSTVVGVAKTRFHSAPATAVLRGNSEKALWVDECGVHIDAVKRVPEMHGPFRVPTMIRLVDQLARGIK